MSRRGYLALVALTLIAGLILVCTKSILEPRQTAPSFVSRAQALGLPPHTPLVVDQWRTVEDLAKPIAQFQTVFWDPRDTESLRRLLRETDTVRGRTVLEIGTGTGLLALCCVQNGAQRVVATDVNPAAIANVVYNAEMLQFAESVDARLVELDRSHAFSVLAEDERFDLIISNPPWENRKPRRIAEYALYDEHFELLDSLLRDMRDHLSPGGRCLLAYGCVEAIHKVQELAEQYGFQVVILDNRDLDSLPNEFLPGMLLEVTPQPE